MKSIARSASMVSVLAWGSCFLNAQPARSLPSFWLDDDTVREMLSAHNQVRAVRQLPPLRWSRRLEEFAQEWAEHLAKLGALEHDYTRRVGQNLFASWGTARRPSFVVKKWEDESKDYDERRFRCSRTAECGHFTQLIWRETKQVGCGVATRGNGQYWVCYYSPPGNVIGDNPY